MLGGTENDELFVFVIGNNDDQFMDMRRLEQDEVIHGHEKMKQDD